VTDHREQSVERLLPGSFGVPSDGMTAECLDAETIAALADGGLSGPAFDVAQKHIADCERCQSVLGTLVRVGAIAPVPVPEPRHATRWLAWAVPLTAAAAALAIWIAVPGAPTPAAPPEKQATRDAAPPAETVVPPSPPAGRESSTASAAPGSAAGLDSTGAAREEGQNVRAKSAAPPPASAPAPQPQALLKQEEAADARRSDHPSQEPGRSNPPAPAREPQATAALQAPPPSALDRPAQLAATAPDTALVIAAPGSTVRWRIVGGSLQRSTDGGVRWEAVPTGGPAVLRSGSAPSGTVFWAVGASGIVLRSTDGRDVSRVPFPEPVDLVAVQASDARTAVVTASGGRRFATSDGGASWQAQ
jgi:hypothetical protein